MKGLFWLVMVGLMPHICAAQDTITFNKTYDFNHGVESGTSVLATENGYLVCATGASTEFNGWRALKLLQVDSLGNEKWRKSYGEIGKVYTSGLYGSMIECDEGGYALGASITDSGSLNSIAVLYKFDQNGDTLWTRKYQKDYKDIVHQVKRTPDGGFALFGVSYYRSPLNPAIEIPRFHLIKTDSLGVMEWDSVYGGGYGTSISVLNNGDFVIAGYGGGGSNYYAKVLKIGINGSQIWQKVYYGGNAIPCNAYVSTSDQEEIYIWGCTDTVIDAGDYPQVPFIASLDSLGNIKWTKYFNNPNNNPIGIYQVKSIGGGKIIAAGAIKDNNPLLLYGGWLVFLDSSQNVIWEKTHTYTQDSLEVLGSNSIYDFQRTKDNGFIATGFGFNDIDSGPNFNYNQDIWLLKLDSLGNYYAPPDTSCQEPCDTVGITETPTLQAKLFPNPTTGTLTVELPNSQNGNLELYNLLGQSVFNATVNGTATLQMDLPQGVYIYRIGQGGLEKMGKLLVE